MSTNNYTDSYDDELMMSERRKIDYENYLVGLSQVLLRIYTYAEIPILTLGAIGHVLSLLTMLKSRNMQTPSFLYHRCLTTSELIYILDCFAQKAIDYMCKVPRISLAYWSYWAAFYSAFMNRLLWSTTGYVILYMTLVIGVDRLIALHIGAHYNRFNKRSIAKSIIISVLLVSLFCNSWESPFENTIVTITFPAVALPGSSPNSSNAVISNTTTTIYALRPRNGPAFYVQLRSIKNWYNIVIRLAYPVVLAALAGAVVNGFLRQRRVRLKYGHRETDRQTRKDKNLFYLLLLNVLLALLQVIPREARRILEFIYPYAKLQQDVENVQLPIDERLHLLSIFYFGHVWGKIIANLCTFINRSLNFYLYFCFNSAFRTEVLKLRLCTQEQEKKASQTSYAGKLYSTILNDVSPSRVSFSAFRTNK